jgi:hypothetical protein
MEKNLALKLFRALRQSGTEGPLTTPKSAS